MSDSEIWAFPPSLQPKPEDYAFELQAVLDASVLLRVEVPDDAFTAQTLGTERVGNGVVIREDGLILTIGYLVTEAATIWITTNKGTVVQGHPLAYDQATGFGLVMPLGKLGLAPIARGSVNSIAQGDDVLVIGQGGRPHALTAKVADKREFCGYWEYVLDEAVFTAPAHPQWGGAALVGDEGKLLGIGSLFVQEALDGKQIEGNMIVPIDLLDPILPDMLKTGRAGGPARPWLGLYAMEVDNRIAIGGLAHGGPAAKAGVKQGDLLLQIAGERVSKPTELFRRLWLLGAAGIDVPLMLARDGSIVNVTVKTGDRANYMKKPQLH